MKKILVIVAILTFSLTACADRQHMIAYSDLPVLAQTFVQKYFNAADVSFIERDRDGISVEYNVYLKNATEIEFDDQGNLQSIDCKRNAIPQGIVPELIMSFVALHYPDQIAVEYHVERRTLNLELNSGLELIFDLEGQFLRIDD